MSPTRLSGSGVLALTGGERLRERFLLVLLLCSLVLGGVGGRDTEARVDLRVLSLDDLLGGHLGSLGA